MRHHHHRPRPRRPQRTRSPSRARERREPPSIATSSQSPPPLPSSCSRPVAVVTAASSPRSCCRWGRRAATLLEPPVPASLPLRAGRSTRSSSLHASKPSRPDAASAAPARAHLVRGQAHGASATVAAATMPQSPHRQPVLDPPSLLGRHRRSWVASPGRNGERGAELWLCCVLYVV
jgi:hypothetical protein